MFCVVWGWDVVTSSTELVKGFLTDPRGDLFFVPNFGKFAEQDGGLVEYLTTDDNYWGVGATAQHILAPEASLINKALVLPAL